MKTFEGKVAIVTGGSSGLGAAAALQFAREGAKVVIAARRNDKSEAVVRQIEELGTEGLFLQTDVSKRAEVEALVEGTLARFGRPDCAVNNAGIVGPVQVPVAEIEEADWDASDEHQPQGRVDVHEIPDPGDVETRQGRDREHLLHLRIQSQRRRPCALLHQ
jgi:NADP-dependent 3-hydroxy acid dehydrogenase YdfG